MNFFDAVKTCFVKYTNFSDRASRSECWLFVLFTCVVSLILGILDALIAGVPFMDYDEVLSPLVAIFSIATFIPLLSVNVRRLQS